MLARLKTHVAIYKKITELNPDCASSLQAYPYRLQTQQLGTESAASAAKAFSDYIRDEGARLHSKDQASPRYQRQEDFDEEDEIEASLS